MRCGAVQGSQVVTFRGSPAPTVPWRGAPTRHMLGPDNRIGIDPHPRKSTPVARRGRKATGLPESAGLPNGGGIACFGMGSVGSRTSRPSSKAPPAPQPPPPSPRLAGDRCHVDRPDRARHPDDERLGRDERRPDADRDWSAVLGRHRPAGVERPARLSRHWFTAYYPDYLERQGPIDRRRGRQRRPASSAVPAVSWIGPIGPTRGSAKVFIDGKLAGTVSLYTTAFRPTRVLFKQRLGQAGEPPDPHRRRRHAWPSDRRRGRVRRASDDRRAVRPGRRPGQPDPDQPAGRAQADAGPHARSPIRRRSPIPRPRRIRRLRRRRSLTPRRRLRRRQPPSPIRHRRRRTRPTPKPDAHADPQPDARAARAAAGRHPRADPDANAGADADPHGGTGGHATAHAGPDAQADGDAHGGPHADTGSDADADAQADRHPGAHADADSCADAASHAGADADPRSHADADPRSNADADPRSDADADPRSHADADPRSHADACPHAGADPGSAGPASVVVHPQRERRRERQQRRHLVAPDLHRQQPERVRHLLRQRWSVPGQRDPAPVGPQQPHLRGQQRHRLPDDAVNDPDLADRQRRQRHQHAQPRDQGRQSDARQVERHLRAQPRDPDRRNAPRRPRQRRRHERRR